MNSFRTRVSFAILTAATGALILAGCSNSPESAPAPAAPPAPATTPSTSAPAAAPVVDPAPPAAQPQKPAKPAPSAKTLGPNGYGKLRFGMTAKQAMASGEVVPNQPGVDDVPGETCAAFDLADDKSPKDNMSVYISPKFGVVAIFAEPGVRTQEGIAEGASFAKVKAAYPSLDAGTHGHFATVPGHDSVRYRFSFNEKNVLVSFFVEHRNQDCYE